MARFKVGDWVSPKVDIGGKGVGKVVRKSPFDTWTWYNVIFPEHPRTEYEYHKGELKRHHKGRC